MPPTRRSVLLDSTWESYVELLDARIFKTKGGLRRHHSAVRAYLDALSAKDFRRLFLGATANSLGDGMSFVALAWIVVNRPQGVAQLGLLAVCYTGPVFIGGWVAGALLDRFDKRHVIAIDCLIRGAAFASIPVTQALGYSPGWLIFAVAGLYGLLKMIPLAGFPSAIPDLVADANLDAANALEGLSYGVAGIVGPAAAGLLIPFVGAANLLLADTASYVIFAVAALSVKRPLKSTAATQQETTKFSDVLKLLMSDVPIVSTTVAFMTFNIAEGMLLVTGPWLAREKLGGPAALGLLLAALSAGELVGSFAAGTRSTRRPLIGIGATELIAGSGFASIYAATVEPLLAVGYGVVGFFSAPMTVWAQSMRLRRLPATFRGRAFGTLRTLMQATPPLGAALAAPLLARGQLTITVTAMVLLAGIPGAALLVLGLVGTDIGSAAETET
jgi:MFS family permease